jgi:ornithine cyclodeaminase/alanine dehydrogenase-like protein (mu-crystallin family)
MPGMTLYLTEDDVGRLLTMEACIEAVTEQFRQWAEGGAANRPRSRAAVAGAVLHVLPAASGPLGRMAAKVYATTRGGARFVVLLFDAGTSELLAILEADRLGQMRTGAASGVASRLLARRDAAVLCVLGTGWQARSQAAAVASVRRLVSIRAFGRDPDRLRRFCREVEAACGVGTTPAGSAEEAVRGADIVATATNSALPVLMGRWIEPGVHVNAVGNNRIERRELDDAAVRRADLIVVDSIDQARIEAGDFVVSPCDAPHQAPLDRAVELSAVVAGRHPGRRSPSEVTLFKSLGLGLEDLAAASVVYDRALEAGAGRPLGRGPAPGVIPAP